MRKIVIALIVFILSALGASAQNCPAPTSSSITFCAVLFASLNPSGPQQAQAGIAFSQTYSSPNMASTTISSGSPTQNGLTANVGSGSSFTVTGTPTTGGLSSAWTIKVTYTNGTMASFPVTVIAGIETGMVVSPNPANVNQSQTQQLKAVAQFNNPAGVDVTNLATWSIASSPTCTATGSTVSSSGLFTASTTAGTCTPQAVFGGQTGTATLTVNAISNPVVFQTTTLPNGQINQPYPEPTTGFNFGQGAQLVVNGGTGPYTFAVTTGSLPTGLSLSSSGLITGTPTSAGAGTSFAITATDSMSHSTAQTFGSGITVASLNTGSSALTVVLTPSTITPGGSSTPAVTNNYSDGSQAPATLSVAGGTIGTPIESTTGSFSANVPAGATLVINQNAFFEGSCAFTLPSISTGDTVASVASTCPGLGYRIAELWYVYNTTANSNYTVTCNGYNGSSLTGCGGTILTGVPSSNTLDQHPSGGSAAAASACNVGGSFTTTQANEIWIAMCNPASATAFSPASGWNAIYSSFATGLPFLLEGQITNAIASGGTSTNVAGFSPTGQNEGTLFATFLANASATGTASLSSGTPTCVGVNGSTLQGLSVSATCTSVITASENGGASTGTATLTNQVTQTDNMVVVTPAAQTCTVSSACPQAFTATGNVIKAQLNATWAPGDNTIISLNTGSGPTVIVNCLKVGTTSLQASFGSLTAGQASVSCVSSGSGTLINATNACPTGVGSLGASLPQSGTGAFTVVVPTNTCAWTSAVNYTIPSGITSLTIEGQTVLNCTGVPGMSSYSCAATDNTIIQDDSSSSASILTINTGSPTTVFRITGITVEPFNSAITAKSVGIFNFAGSSKNFRWDHSHMVLDGNDNAGAQWSGQIEGVVDHNLMTLGGQNSYTNQNRVDNDLFDTVGNGDGAWFAATQWGSQHALFIEDNYIVGGYTGDCDNSGRAVIRYNTFFNSQDASGAVHSTKDYGGAARGCRSLEFYQNYMSGTGVGDGATGGEGSSLLEWGNTLGNLSDAWFWDGGLYRNRTDVNGAPTNASPPNGWAWCGTTIATHYNITGTGASSWDGNSSTATGYPCLDGLGRGQQQDAMNGQPFPARANTTVGGQTWPNQFLEPAYFWMNTLPSGMSGEFNNRDISSQNNRDYYYDCNSYNSSCSGGFTGAFGTGFGLLSARPSTCTAGPGGTYGGSPTGSYGVAYWATDKNTLYVCTATNTWTAIYTPYQYPQPLNGDLPH